MGAVYSVEGLTAATAATANHAIAALWNNDSTKRIGLIEVGIYESGTTGRVFILNQITTRGTPGSTITPDADNNWDNDGEAPPSGALLDLAAYTVQPTLQTPGLFGVETTVQTGSEGSGYVWAFQASGGGRDFELPAGEGLAITQLTAAITAISEVYFVWEEF